MNTHLRQRFIDYFILNRYLERTIESYTQAIRKLANGPHTTPVATGIARNARA